MKKNCLLLLFAALFAASAFAQKPNNFADGFLQNAEASKELTEADLADYAITHQHVSSTSGVHHFYYRQRHEGIEVHSATASVHILPSGRLLRVHNSFVSELASKIVGSTAPSISASQAILAAADQMGYTLSAPLEVIENNGGANRQQKFTKAGISREDIPVKLMYQPLSDGTLKLVWNLSIDATAEPNWWELRVDAATGEILDKTNWTVHCNLEEAHAHTLACNHNDESVSIDEEVTAAAAPAMMVGTYNVYAMPVESPNFGGRTSVVDPDNAIASPFGWHDTNGVVGPEYTITRGNNVHAYEDGDNPGFSPDGGGSLIFDFPINTTYSQANQSESAAITNLFYWSNLCHDLWYLYGFDEASGNFQENNYGNGGSGSDGCNSEAQDGSGTCNANMSTPTDGSNPRMQMYVCNSRDGDLDNGVIVHEYGHGISIRLTGGAGNSGCLSNQEQMGEGWSDYFGMVMSIEVGDAGPDSRGMGTWLFGQGPNGNGIRPFPYSTDMGINPQTYDDIKTESVPHGVGSVWCTMLWEMTWDLIGVYGFDEDFYNGTGGNNIAMALVTEGLKLQPCSPGFVDGRDAILAADEALNGGANVCLIWEAFARRGLGENAVQGSTGSRADGTENFDVPASCVGSALSFTVASINTTEGDVGELPAAPGDCRPYNEFEIGVSLSQDPTLDPADVSIVEVGSNTSADANDYELIGGDMIFAEAGVQSATLIIYNDALIEDLEDIEFELVINNPDDTDAFIGAVSISKIKVGNDDFAPEDQVAIDNLVTATFETDMESFTSVNETSGEGPTSVYAQGDADDATSTSWTVPVPLDGSTGLVYANDDDCDCTMEDVRFISPTYDFSNYTSVELRYDIFFEGRTYQSNTETADLMISTNGGSSFTSIEEIDGVNGSWREELVDLSAYAGMSDVQIAFRYSDGTGWLYGIAIDHVRIDGTVLSPPEVASTLGFVSEQEVLANQDIYFYNADGSILARLENGPQDLGCVEVTIDRAGTGATEFWDNLPEHYLLDKTYLFTPEFNGPDYSYTVTLYYSADEVAGWEAITGNAFAQASLIKHPTAISDVTPANPEGTGPIEQEVETRGTLPYAPDDYFITATFNTGFSGMGVGMPGTEALPVELVSFEGEHLKGVANRLTWQTASEIDNDRFELERSFDGRNFELLSTSPGFGTTTEINNYEFYDSDYKTGEHYYRLKQVDVDGRFEYSEIVVLDVNANDNKVSVFPNPAQDDISVSFGNDVSGDFALTIFSASGKKLMAQPISLNGERTFNLSIESLPKGVYYAELVDELNTLSQQFKFVKE